MPPPDGPFFGSKPLLYYGEEPSTDATPISQESYIPAFSAPYPAPRRGYYPVERAPNPYGSLPFNFGGNRLPPMPLYQRGWGARSPYNSYPPYPAGAGR